MTTRRAPMKTQRMYAIRSRKGKLSWVSPTKGAAQMHLRELLECEDCFEAYTQRGRSVVRVEVKEVRP